MRQQRQLIYYNMSVLSYALTAYSVLINKLLINHDCEGVIYLITGISELVSVWVINRFYKKNKVVLSGIRPECRKHFVFIILLYSCSTAAFTLTNMASLKVLPTYVDSLLSQGLPIIEVALFAILLRKMPSKANTLLIALYFVGLMIVTLQYSGQSLNLQAVILCLISYIIYGIGDVLLQYIKDKDIADSDTTQFIICACSGVIGIVLFFVKFKGIQWEALKWELIGLKSLLYVAINVTWIIALRANHINWLHIGSAAYFLVALINDIFILKESVKLDSIIGASIMTATLILFLVVQAREDRQLSEE